MSLTAIDNGDRIYLWIKTVNERLSIYDITGREVRVLLDENQSAGIHHVSWDGRDGSGKPVPSGVYISRLETDTGISQQKMMLMK